MYKRRRSLFWWLSIGSSLGLLSCLALSLLFRGPSAPPTAGAFELAQEQWMAQKPTHYQLAISWKGFSAMCKQTLEVQQEQVIAILQNTCTEARQSPASVTKLFAHIEPYVTTWMCGPNGCGCDRLSMDVIYDP